MKTSLIVFGVVFLVLGAVLYYMPIPTAGAITTTTGQEGSQTRTSYASISLPLQLTLASIIIGLVLLMLGIVLPSPYRVGKSDLSKDHLVQTKEHITGEGDKRNVIRERREHNVEKAV